MSDISFGKRIRDQKRNFARKLLQPFLKYFYDTHFVMGSKDRLILGERCALSNTLFNVSSGTISIGSRSIFGQGVMITTGRHEFKDGMRLSMNPNNDDGSWGGGDLEVPSEGFDISIGAGSFIASGSIIIGGVTIGENCIVAAGSVVTKDFPSFSFLAGIPAVRIRDTREL